MLPCGTPDNTGKHLDKLLLDRYDSNHFQRVPVMPMFQSFTSSLLCGTLSKALRKPTEIVSQK